MAEQMTDEEMKALLDAAANDKGRAYIPDVGFRLLDRCGEPSYILQRDFLQVVKDEMTERRWQQWVDKGTYI